MIQQGTMEQPKFRLVFESLCNAIESGVYVPGRRLPSERMLAAEYGVNVATIRRAFRDLVAANMVEKRIGDGTYIRTASREPFEDTRSVNFLISDYEGEMQRELVQLATQESSRLKIDCRICYAGNTDLTMQLRTFIRFHQPTILLGDLTLNEEALRELRRAPKLFVVISNRLDHLGIPSVIGNDYTGIRILIDYLRGLGHERIALLHNNSGHPIENVQIAIWKSGGVPNAFATELELRADVPSREHPTEYAFNCVLRHLLPSRATALIALNDELAIGALSAATELGLRIPEDLSVISLGNTPAGRFANPPLTELDPNLSEHIREAFALLQRNRQLPGSPELLRIVEPELVERRSCAPAPRNQIKYNQ